MQFYVQFCQAQPCRTSVFSKKKKKKTYKLQFWAILQSHPLRITPSKAFSVEDAHSNIHRRDIEMEVERIAWVTYQLLSLSGCSRPRGLPGPLSVFLPLFLPPCVQIAGNLKNSQGQCFEWLKKENRNNTSFSFSQMSTFGKKEGREGRGRKSTTLCFPEKK